MRDFKQCNRLYYCWLGCCCITLAAYCQGALDHQQEPDEWLIGWRGESYRPAQPFSTAVAAAAAKIKAQAHTGTYGAAPATAAAATARVGLLHTTLSLSGPTAQAAKAATLPAKIVADADVIHGPAQPPAAAAFPIIDLSKVAAAQHGQPWVQMLSWQPRLVLYHDFLSDQEADRLLAMAAEGRPGTPMQSVQAVHDELMSTVEERITNWTNMPATHIEGWQVQPSFPADESVLHTDLLIDRLTTEDYQRLRTATLMVFLESNAGTGVQQQQQLDRDAVLSNGSSSNGSKGSGSSWSLVFPYGVLAGSMQSRVYADTLQQGRQVLDQLVAAGTAQRQHSRQQQGPNNLLQTLQLQTGSCSSSMCIGSSNSSGSSSTGLQLTGFSKGSALLLWNVLVDGQSPDAAAAHVWCPPNGPAAATAAEAGDRDKAPACLWVATTWLHNMPVGQDDALALAATCTDKNPACSNWAAAGFCDDAPGFMLGLRGHCRSSCNDCQVCTEPTMATGSVPGGSGSGSGTLDSSSSSDGTPAAHGQYTECLYRNMHSLRQQWSQLARGTGVRRARNAIRRDMKFQATPTLPHPQAYL